MRNRAPKKDKTTKKKIVSAAWKLFYEQSYESTTVEEIVEESGTSKGSFIIILKERTPCSARFPSSSTKSMRSLCRRSTKAKTPSIRCCI